MAKSRPDRPILHGVFLLEKQEERKGDPDPDDDPDDDDDPDPDDNPDPNPDRDVMGDKESHKVKTK